MQVFNQTRYVSEFTQGMEPSGRDFLSLVIKGTFDFPPAAGSTPLTQQGPERVGHGG